MYIAIAIHIMFILWCIPILHSMVYTYITFYGVYVYYNALTPVYTLPLPCTVSQQGLAAAVRWSGRAASYHSYAVIGYSTPANCRD